MSAASERVSVRRLILGTACGVALLLAPGFAASELSISLDDVLQPKPGGAPQPPAAPSADQLWTPAGPGGAVAGRAMDLAVSLATVPQPQMLREPSQFVVRVDLQNRGRDPLFVFALDIPEGGLLGDQFDVRRDGQKVPYIGPVAKLAPPSPRDFREIRPGADVSAEVDLAQYYDLSVPGAYTVSFDGTLTTARSVSAGISALRDGEFGARDAGSPGDAQVGVPARSNTVAVQLQSGLRDRSLPTPSEQWEPFRGGSVGFASCNQSQQSAIKQAVEAARRKASQVRDSFRGCRQGANANYVTWFGAQDQNRWARVAKNYTAISDALQNKTLEFNCNCNRDNVYAYVYPQRPYKIWLCGAFWEADNTGIDAKFGVIVHELSHFNVIAGTDDHVYGQSNCKRLARSEPRKAIDNADNHEYFVETGGMARSLEVAGLSSNSMDILDLIRGNPSSRAALEIDPQGLVAPDPSGLDGEKGWFNGGAPDVLGAEEPPEGFEDLETAALPMVGLSSDDQMPVGLSSSSGNGQSLTVRNRAPCTAYAAVAWWDQGAWRSRGWYAIEPDQSKTLLTGYQSRSAYVFAKSGASSWGGRYCFRVDQSRAFDFRNAAACERSAASQKFMEVKFDQPGARLTLDLK